MTEKSPKGKGIVTLLGGLSSRTYGTMWGPFVEWSASRSLQVDSSHSPFHTDRARSALLGIITIRVSWCKVELSDVSRTEAQSSVHRILAWQIASPQIPRL